MYVVMARFRLASRQAHDLTQTLALRVAAKEQELGDSFKRLEALAREQERCGDGFLRGLVDHDLGIWPRGELI